MGYRKVDVRLPGKGDSNSHGARPVNLTITMIKWIRTSRLSIENSLSGVQGGCDANRGTEGAHHTTGQVAGMKLWKMQVRLEAGSLRVERSDTG